MGGLYHRTNAAPDRRRLVVILDKMTIILRRSDDLADIEKSLLWYAVTGTTVTLNPENKLADLGARLEKSFDCIRDDWWRIGKELGQTPTARLAHMPTAASYNCDFGLMMAWVKLTEAVYSELISCLVVCDDPWLFRELAEINGVWAGRQPSMWIPILGYWLRGYLARGRLAGKVAVSAIRLRDPRRNIDIGEKTILAYGHPGSSPDGQDIYFGSLMKDIPVLKRMIHTDGDVKVIKRLAGDRTAGFHAWGSFWYASFIIFKRWRLQKSDLSGAFSWLIRRACAIENSTAAPATNAWQIHCQNNWLRQNKPSIILWPWENHPWERELCRSAKKMGVKTIGYQHAVIGPQQFNPGPASNPDGFDSIPDRIICSGPAYHDQLIRWGMPEDRLVIGGAYRIAKFEGNFYDPNGPVFVATSSDTDITTKLMLAVDGSQKEGRKFLVKIHPLYPKDIEETENVQITTHTIPEQQGLSAVFYGTGTSGLEGMLAQIPTFRLRPDDQVAVNVLPEGVEPVPVSIHTLDAALNEAVQPPPLKWDSIYAAVNLDVWKRELEVV